MIEVGRMRKNGWITKEIRDSRTGRMRPARLKYQNGKVVKKRWIKCNNYRKARELGSSFKDGYPDTYLESQTRPIYRSQRKAQERELERLIATSNMTEKQARNVLERKYAKKNMVFLPNAQA